jgi:hypothetical protein
MFMTMHVNDHHRPHGGPIVFGGALVILGGGFLLHRLGLLPEGMSPWQVWPAMLIWAGLVHLIRWRRGEQLWGLALLGFGSVFLANTLGCIPWDWGYVWPVLLILLGLGIVFGRGGRRRGCCAAATPSGADTVAANLVFSGKEERFDGRPFRGGRVTCRMSGYKLDLRGAELPDGEAVLEVDVFMGGIELLVPRDWSIIVELSPVMGGVENHSAMTGESPKGRLVLRGKMFMGGVEIKN